MAKTKKHLKAKEPIKIRFKKLSNGNKSIYLDLYTNGKRQYEFLKLYLIPEVDETSKALNTNAMQTANAIKAQRIISLAQEGAGLKTSSNYSKMLLTDWIEQYRKDQTKKGIVQISNVDTLKRILIAYKGENVSLANVDKSYCLGFIDFLKNKYISERTQKPLDKSSAQEYCRRLIAVLNAAVKAEIIQNNPFNKIQGRDRIKSNGNQREFLTIDEVKTLIATPCKLQNIKNAFLFSCCCGLRISDIMALTWGNVITDGNQTRLEIVVKKTKQPLYLPLSNEALKYMPQRGEAKDSDKVFNLPRYNTIEVNVKKWVTSAGVKKNVTFHTARHTFATTMLTLGTDLYTTSKLLGHTNITTTQIYAEIVNQKKTDAVNLMNNIF